MNEVDFKNWLLKSSVNKKVQSDIISRIKKIEREIENCDIDEQYRSDRCKHLMSLFSNMGVNDEMKKFTSPNFPIGKYHMNNFRYAIRHYVRFCDEMSNSNSSKSILF